MAEKKDAGDTVFDLSKIKFYGDMVDSILYVEGEIYIQKKSGVLLIVSPGEKVFLTFKKPGGDIDISKDEMDIFVSEQKKLSEAGIDFTLDEAIGIQKRD